MKKNCLVSKVSFLTGILSAWILLGTCSANLGGDATIVLDLSPWNAANSRTALTDPIAPVLDTVEISVTGPGMSAITQTVSVSNDSFTLEVPAGPSRQISINALAKQPYGNSPIISRYGEATVDLLAGLNSITIETNFETKLIVPDYRASKLYQFDDMSGVIQVELDFTSPYDIDFDKYGRIYVARNNYTNSGIFSYTHLSGSAVQTQLSLNSLAIAGTVALAIDSNADVLYHITNGESTNVHLFAHYPITTNESGMDNLVTLPATVTLGYNSTGLTVDNQGFLYLLGSVEGFPSIIKLDPRTNITSPTLVSSVTLASIPDLAPLTAFDLLAKGDRIYLSINDQYGPDLGNIIELDEELNVTQSYAGTVYKVRRFLATRNRRFYLTEDRSNNDANDRIISFKDIADEEPEFLNIGTFLLYSFC